MGLFGIGEVIRNLEQEHRREAFVRTVTGVWPSRADLNRIVAPILRGSAIGSVLGLLPGGGALLASFGAYAFEKKILRRIETVWKGSPGRRGGP